MSMIFGNVLDNDGIREKFVDVATGVGHHGSFLVAYAEMALLADPVNFELIKPTSLAIIEKYKL